MVRSAGEQECAPICPGNCLQVSVPSPTSSGSQESIWHSPRTCDLHYISRQFFPTIVFMARIYSLPCATELSCVSLSHTETHSQALEIGSKHSPCCTAGQWCTLFLQSGEDWTQGLTHARQRLCHELQPQPWQGLQPSANRGSGERGAGNSHIFFFWGHSLK